MITNFFIKNLKNEKGSAIILALCTILLLTALGTVALMVSGANVSMSSKTVKWSKDFYKLDSQAEKYINTIDELLAEAEQDAKNYVLYRLDRLNPSDYPHAVPADIPIDVVNKIMGPTVMGFRYNMKESGGQSFFYGNYQSDWTYAGGEYDLDDYRELTIAYHATPMEYPNISQISKSFNPAAPITAEEAYMLDIENYSSELFDRVYFHMLSCKLEKLISDVAENDIVLDKKEGGGGLVDYGIPIEESKYCTKKFMDLASKAWDDVEPKDKDIGIFIRVNEVSLGHGPNTLDDLKEVNVYLNVVMPEYKTVLKHISTPFLGNPIWANALSVQGEIEFANGSNATINGDVYASGYRTVNKVLSGMTFHETISGITVNTSAEAHIYGNVYAAGNLQIVGNSGKLFVSPNTTSNYDAKNSIYSNNSLFYDSELNNTNLPQGPLSREISYYTSHDHEGIPVIFEDFAHRGNVYCNDLLVSDTVISGAELVVNKNVWTKDDIQMDGKGSTIKIGDASGSTYYIGLNPFSSSNNPNESSSVINNFAYSGGVSDSKIILNSFFYIPGVAFYDMSPNYYKSLESAGARNSLPVSLINAYLYRDLPGVTEDSIKQYYNTDGEAFDLFKTDIDEAVRKKAFAAFVAEQSVDGNQGVKTNILTELTVPIEGYVAELALIQTDNDSTAKIYTTSPDPIPNNIEMVNASNNNTKYSYLGTDTDNKFINLFDAKTKKLGTSDKSGFNDFVSSGLLADMNDSDIIYFSGSSSVLDIHTYNRGIVYCDGDLTIMNSGTSTFNGTIICTGDVEIVGNNVKIVYDESIILDKLKNSSKLRAFFQKGNMGEKVGDLMEYSTDSGYRAIPERYKVKEWIEKNVENIA